MAVLASLISVVRWRLIAPRVRYYPYCAPLSFFGRHGSHGSGSSVTPLLPYELPYNSWPARAACRGEIRPYYCSHPALPPIIICQPGSEWSGRPVLHLVPILRSHTTFGKQGQNGSGSPVIILSNMCYTYYWQRKCQNVAGDQVLTLCYNN